MDADAEAWNKEGTGFEDQHATLQKFISAKVRVLKLRPLATSCNPPVKAFVAACRAVASHYRRTAQQHALGPGSRTTARQESGLCQVHSTIRTECNLDLDM